jgi:hypothetical protein
MSRLIGALLDFAGKITSLALAGSFIAFLAGEVRLVAFKKASEGSTKITKFTERMTGMKLDL